MLTFHLTLTHFSFSLKAPVRMLISSVSSSLYCVVTLVRETQLRLE